MDICAKQCLRYMTGRDKKQDGRMEGRKRQTDEADDMTMFAEALKVKQFINLTEASQFMISNVLLQPVSVKGPSESLSLCQNVQLRGRGNRHKRTSKRWSKEGILQNPPSKNDEEIRRLRRRRLLGKERKEGRSRPSRPKRG